VSAFVESTTCIPCGARACQTKNMDEIDRCISAPDASTAHEGASQVALAIAQQHAMVCVWLHVRRQVCTENMNKAARMDDSGTRCLLIAAMHSDTGNDTVYRGCTVS
jgi:hypothetical protein